MVWSTTAVKTPPSSFSTASASQISASPLKMLSPLIGLGAKGVFVLREGGAVQLAWTAVCSGFAFANVSNRITAIIVISFRLIAVLSLTDQLKPATVGPLIFRN